MRAFQIFNSVNFPLAYVSSRLLHGTYCGYYPYHFFEARTFGYRRIGAKVAVLGASFILVSTAFVVVGRMALFFATPYTIEAQSKQS